MYHFQGSINWNYVPHKKYIVYLPVFVCLDGENGRINQFQPSQSPSHLDQELMPTDYTC
jgi:hypothetical protein